MLKFSSENLPPYHREYWEAQKDEQGYFVQLKKNRIEKVLPSDMRRFVIEWIDKHFIDTKVRNKVITAPIFNPVR